MSYASKVSFNVPHTAMKGGIDCAVCCSAVLCALPVWCIRCVCLSNRGCAGLRRSLETSDAETDGLMCLGLPDVYDYGLGSASIHVTSIFYRSIPAFTSFHSFLSFILSLQERRERERKSRKRVGLRIAEQSKEEHFRLFPNQLKIAL